MRRDGFPVSARVSRWIEQTAPELDGASKAIFLPDGKAPAAGSLLRNVRLAETLRALADHGRAGFYEGEVAKKLAKLGGFFTERDLAAQHAYWGEPIRGTYRGVTIYETPAPTQGFTVLEMLNLIEPLDLGPFLGPDHVHLLVQAKQIAYHDRDRWLADPRFVEVPIERLISKGYADKRRNLIDGKRALPWDKVPSHGSLTGDTVYVAAVDAEGNAASLIFSLYGVFGSCVTSAETGVVLQNRGAYFSLDPKHPNRLEPGKVPLHTLIASLAFRDDRLWAALGCMGADGQPQIHLQTYVAMIDFGQRHPAGARRAALAVGPLRPGRSARHAAHRGALSARDDRRARAPRPSGGSLGRLERACGPCPRHYPRRANWRACRRLRSPQRRRGGRILRPMFDLIAEQKIAEAIARGELDNLPGAGRPLDLDDDALIPEELRLAYRILKNAGYLPPELETLNEIAQLERIAMGNATAVKKLALLKAKIESRYYGKVLARLG